MLNFAITSSKSGRLVLRVRHHFSRARVRNFEGADSWRCPPSAACPLMHGQTPPSVLSLISITLLLCLNHWPEASYAPLSLSNVVIIQLLSCHSFSLELFFCLVSRYFLSLLNRIAWNPIRIFIFDTLFCFFFPCFFFLSSLADRIVTILFI